MTGSAVVPSCRRPAWTTSRTDASDRPQPDTLSASHFYCYTLDTFSPVGLVKQPLLLSCVKQLGWRYKGIFSQSKIHICVIFISSISNIFVCLPVFLWLVNSPVSPIHKYEGKWDKFLVKTKTIKTLWLLVAFMDIMHDCELFWYFRIFHWKRWGSSKQGMCSFSVILLQNCFWQEKYYTMIKKTHNRWFCIMSPFKYHQPHTRNKGNVSNSCHFLKWLQTRFNHCIFLNIVTFQSNLRCSEEESSNFRNKLHFLHHSSGFNSKKYCYLYPFLKKCLDPSTSAYLQSQGQLYHTVHCF